METEYLFQYCLYNSWPDYGFRMSLSSIALIHMLGAFALVAFLIGHNYMITTGHNHSCHLKAMCTGWEEVPANDGSSVSLDMAA